MLENGYEPTRTVVLAFGFDEESGGFQVEWPTPSAYFISKSVVCRVRRCWPSNSKKCSARMVMPCWSMKDVRCRLRHISGARFLLGTDDVSQQVTEINLVALLRL